MTTVNSKPSMRRRGPPRPRDPAATRAALVSAAATLFNGPGYFATDTNAIARTAGYAPASFYKHFEDKASILLAVYALYAAEEWDGLRAAIEGAPTPEVRLRRALNYIAGLHRKWSTFRAGLRTVATLEPAVAEAIRASRGRQIALLAAATGLSPAKHGAALLLALAIVERLGDAIGEAERHAPVISRRAMLSAAERALAPLLATATPLTSPEARGRPR